MAGRLATPDLKRAGTDDDIWFRYSISSAGVASFKIWTLGGALVRTISGLGSRPAGTYYSRSRAVHWDRRDDVSARLAPGVYYVNLHIDGGSAEDQVRFVLP